MRTLEALREVLVSTDRIAGGPGMAQRDTGHGRGRSWVGLTHLLMMEVLRRLAHPVSPLVA